MNNEKLMEYQLIEQQMQSLSQNLENLENHLEEMNGILKTLDEFRELKKGDKIKVPIANGIFADATLEDSESLNVNVGSGIVVKKDVEGAKNVISSQIKDLEEYRQETTRYYQDMYAKMQQIQAEIIAEQEKEEKKK